ncbi:MAG TPA: TetR/AcrR family transcriptional regulator [Solirubrobacterales bacterium]|nr:TetR/AcrR family transcriptional regulator [Solirubrobacterales bacterium]
MSADRIAEATIATVGARGYDAATEDEIVARAGVSRGSFHDLFADKEACVLGAQEAVADRLVATMATAGEGGQDWPELSRERLRALLGAFAAEPDLVRFSLIAVPAAGEPVAGRYDDLLGRMLETLTDGVEEARVRRRPEPAAERGLLETMLLGVVEAVATGEEEQIEALLPQLTLLFLMPYVGRPRAVRAAGPAQTFSSSQAR